MSEFIGFYARTFVIFKEYPSSADNRNRDNFWTGPENSLDILGGGYWETHSRFDSRYGIDLWD